MREVTLEPAVLNCHVNFSSFQNFSTSTTCSVLWGRPHWRIARNSIFICRVSLSGGSESQSGGSVQNKPARRRDSVRSTIFPQFHWPGCFAVPYGTQPHQLIGRRYRPYSPIFLFDPYAADMALTRLRLYFIPSGNPPAPYPYLARGHDR